MAMVTRPRVDATLLARMRATWRLMPGLRLTLPGAMTLWQLDALVCDVALRVLIEEGLLMRAPDGRVMRRPRAVLTPEAACPARVVPCGPDHPG